MPKSTIDNAGLLDAILDLRLTIGGRLDQITAALELAIKSRDEMRLDIERLRQAVERLEKAQRESTGASR